MLHALTPTLSPYKGVGATWLRWALLDDGLLPTGEELALQQAEQERQRAEQERQRAEREYRRAERLAARLRELGVEPEDL